MRKIMKALLPILLIACLCFTGCGDSLLPLEEDHGAPVSIDEVSEYSDKAYAEIDNNVPNFDESLGAKGSFEHYSELDSYGRCGPALANIGIDLMPTEERGSIGQVKPSGWHTVKYDFVDGKYLYNRCHLIGFQLTGENANEQNLITGTRYMNVDGMLPFENMVADYIKETENHVLYRVTPIFEENELVARGVQIEALSVEDNGEGISFNVFCYNVQPGVTIDYATGESFETGDLPTADGENANDNESAGMTYILNTNNRKFHAPDCQSAKDIKSKNKQEYTGARDDLIDMGYEPCKRCNP